MKTISFFIGFLCFPLLCLAQLPEPAFLYDRPLAFNPALAGYTGNSRITAAYQHLYPSLSIASQAYELGYDQYFAGKARIGAGLRLNQSMASDGLQEIFSQAGLVLSSRLIEHEHFILVLGGELDFIENRAGREVTPYETEPVTGFDGNGGFLFILDQLQTGLVVNNIGEPDISLVEGITEKEQRNYFFHVNYQFYKENSKFKFSPDLVLISREGYFEKPKVDIAEWMFGLHFMYKWARLGGRFNSVLEKADNVNVYAGAEYKKFRLSTAYVLTISPLTNKSAGSWEFNLNYAFGRKNSGSALKELVAF